MSSPTLQAWAMQPKLYLCGIRGNVSRNTLANANEHRSWRIYADFAQVLIDKARKLYANEDFGTQLKHTAYALDSTFITRAKSNLDYQRLCHRKVDKSTGLRCDQTIRLNGFYASQDYPAVLRRISYFDIEANKRFVFLTNNFALPALAIARLYSGNSTVFNFSL